MMDIISNILGIWAVIAWPFMLLSAPVFASMKVEDIDEYGTVVISNLRRSLIKRCRKALVPKTVFWGVMYRFSFSFLSGTSFFILYELGTQASFGESMMHLAGLLLGGTAIVAYTMSSTIPQQLGKYWFDRARLGAMIVSRWCDLEEAKSMLEKAARSPIGIWRRAAITGFKQMPPAIGLPALESLSRDPDAQIATLATEGLADVQAVYAGRKPMSVKALASYIEGAGKTYIVKKKGASRQGMSGSEYMEVDHAYLEQIVFSQIHLRRSHPHVYCLDCNAWSEEIRFELWDWVRCSKCKDAMALMADVHDVIAQIGEPQAWQLQDGKLRIGLWNEKTHIARNADVTILEIIGGSDIHYDWAVSAVVEKLHNENPAYGKDIRVRLVDNPALDPNTLRLLKDLDPQFQGG